MICVSATNDFCTEVIPGAMHTLSALLMSWMPLLQGQELWRPALLSLGQGRDMLWLKQGWDPGGQPVTPSTALDCLCGLGVTVQRSNLLVWLLPDLFQSSRAALAKSICLSNVSGWTRGAGVSSSAGWAGEKVGHSWRQVEAQLGLGGLRVTCANRGMLLPFSTLPLVNK